MLEGERPYNFLTRSRGSSKTGDLGAVALSMLVAAERAERLYWLASDADQGALAIDAVAGYVARTPGLGERVEIQARRINVPATGTRLDVLPADAPGAWGLNAVGRLLRRARELARRPGRQAALGGGQLGGRQARRRAPRRPHHREHARPLRPQGPRPRRRQPPLAGP